MLHFLDLFFTSGQFLNIIILTIVASSTNCWITLSCFFSHTELIFLIFSLPISSSELQHHYVTYLLPATKLCTIYRSSSILVPICRSFRSKKVWSPTKEGMILLLDHRRLCWERNTSFAKCCLWESRCVWIYLFDDGAFFLPFNCCNSLILFLTIPRYLFLASNILIIIHPTKIIKLKWHNEDPLSSGWPD